MQIVKYDSSHRAEWDAFIDRSKNGTFLFKRDYMEYHSDRFTDCSFLFYERNKLLAVMPANVRMEEHTLYTHQGLTYGGLVMGREIVAVQVLSLFDEWLAYLREQMGMQKVVYRPVPYIYHNYPAEEDLYALFRHHAIIDRRLISTVIDCADPIPFSRIRRRHLKKCEEAGVEIVQSTDFAPFWDVLESRLQEKYRVHPVHSLEEITYLYNKFPAHIQLLEARMDGRVVGGCVNYLMNNLIHIQYSSATDEGMELGVLDKLFYHTTYEVEHPHRYVDIGNSNEEGGWVLNENLIFRKETCGGRAVMFDSYELKL